MGGVVKGKGHLWTVEEVERLMHLKALKKPWREIALELGRSESACRGKYCCLQDGAEWLPKPYKAWTMSEMRAVCELRESGKDWREIADAVGHTYHSTRSVFYQTTRRKG